MSKIILQPTADKIAYKNYVNTIMNSVSTKIIEKYVDMEIYSEITAQYPNGQAFIWGVLNGKNDVTKKKWERIARGDIVLFSKKGSIFSSATITMAFNNKGLAQELWGTDKDGNTWENIYLVGDVKNISIPYAILNPLLGYKENNVIRGFTVLNQRRSEILDLKFDLFSNEICEEISEKEYRDFITKWDNKNELSIEGRTQRRREQSFLRHYLFRGKSFCACGICGRSLPINMLITSHIKRRSECSKKEKLDYKNVVMPMCKFGCDDLYEKGYIYVHEGVVKVNDKKWLTEDLREEMSKLEGRRCEYYNENTKGYFEAHREKYYTKVEMENDSKNYK